MRNRCSLLAAALALGTASTAFASPGDIFRLSGAPEGDDDGDDDGDDADHDEGFFQLRLSTQFGPEPGNPVSLSPDLRYTHGAFEVGLLHSSEAITGFSGITSGSVCLAKCDELSSRYHGGMLQAGYTLYGKESITTLQAGAVASAVDPFDLGFKLGIEHLRLVPDLILLTAKPNIIIGESPAASRLNVPVSIGLLWFIQLESGVSMPLDHASDTWQLPVSIKFAYPIKDVFLDAAVTFPALAGGDDVVTGGENIAVTFGLDFTMLLNRL